MECQRTIWGGQAHLDVHTQSVAISHGCRGLKVEAHFHNNGYLYIYIYTSFYIQRNSNPSFKSKWVSWLNTFECEFFSIGVVPSNEI